MKEDIQSADKKPEKYVGPDGKTKIRMVPVDRQVVKKEANVDEISLKDLQKKITNTGMASTKKAGNMDKTKNDLAALRKRLSGLTPVKEAVEDDEPASPDEAGMAMDQAKFIGYVAEEIMEYIQGNNEFPEWMQNKLSALHEKAKGMHAVMAGKYESVEETRKYTPPTKAEIEADKKKDRAGKKRPSISAKSINKSIYKNVMAGKYNESVKEEMDETYRSVNEMGPRHTSKPMKSRFGGAVDSKKFDAYKKFVKQRNVDEPTVRMVIDNPNDAESKRMMKNANIAKAVELRKAAMKESVNEAMDQKKFSAGAKALTSYAQKNGGVDKADFMKAAKMLDQIGRVNLLQAGQLLSRLNRLVDGMDTDVRERIYIELKKVGLVESVQEETVNLEELTAAEKKLVDQMYDKKGNLTPLGKKVMNHGKKPGDKNYVEQVDEARRKGAPKITGDSIAIQRAKDAELNKALGRTKTGRKKPVRTPTSTQRSLAQLRGDKK